MGNAAVFSEMNKKELKQMNVKLAHTSITVTNLEKALDFYNKALDMTVVSTKELPHITIVLLKDSAGSEFELEILCPKAETVLPEEKSTHFAVVVAEYDEIHNLHKEMGCIQRELPHGMAYFITDPDGNQIEIMK